jgi:hypothetical protein
MHATLLDAPPPADAASRPRTELGPWADPGSRDGVSDKGRLIWRARGTGIHLRAEPDAFSRRLSWKRIVARADHAHPVLDVHRPVRDRPAALSRPAAGDRRRRRGLCGRISRRPASEARECGRGRAPRAADRVRRPPGGEDARHVRPDPGDASAARARPRFADVGDAGQPDRGGARPAVIRRR